MKRDSQILIRVSEAEKNGFEIAADLAGIGVSAWARERLRAVAIQELQQAGIQIPFVKPIAIKGETKDGTKD